MNVSFIQYPLMISPENVSLDKTKLKILINFKFKFQYVLFYIFHFYKNVRGVQYWLVKA